MIFPFLFFYVVLVSSNEKSFQQGQFVMRFIDRYSISDESHQ
jgi:hypothetical protein